MNNLKNHRNLILKLSNEKTFTVDPLFNKGNDRVVTFGNELYENRRMPSTKNPASIMVIGVVASNKTKMYPVWFERSYRLTSPIYKEVLESKVLAWVKKITKKSEYVFQQDGPSWRILSSSTVMYGS